MLQDTIEQELEEDPVTQALLKEIAEKGLLPTHTEEIKPSDTKPEEGFSANTQYLGIRIGDFM